MAQFYLLSVVFNILAAMTLAGDYFAQRVPLLSSAARLRDSRSANIVVGAAAALTGLVKLVVLAPGETVVIAGDLLPAATGMVMGGALLLGVFRRHAQSADAPLPGITRAIATYRVPLAFVGLGVALVHFLVPGAPLL